MTNNKQLRELAEKAGAKQWSWWTSCSFLRLTFAEERDGGAMSAFVCADGVASIDCSEGVQEFIEVANPATVLALLDAYEALQAECEKLRKDAERYRWLSQRLVGASFDWDDEGMTILAFEMPDGVSIGADCDKNIDAAMQGARPC